MTIYVCVHGHFYQPPRENPWLEEVEIQRTAAPYENWNERITAECYSPNGAARILGEKGLITAIQNNYSRMSFNFGPTLLSWLEEHSPHTYENILRADTDGRKRFSGHGPAIAQAYNHMILPLASDRDKRTQILWGIADFEKRFKRFPEGMWLPETAVDLKTLEFLSEEGILFTILSPFQASRIRLSEGVPWTGVRGGKIDPYTPYRCQLPSGRTIALFFYDGRISQDIAFGGLLRNGEMFAQRFLSRWDRKTGEGRIISVATDGETYGHHQKYGDMALAYCLDRIEGEMGTELTIFGEFLEKHPVTREVEIIENSSWSCVHGVERWRDNCGCCTGMNHDWNQSWRKPLREGLDWLHGELESIFSDSLKGKVRDPWLARDEYIHLILERSKENTDNFIKSHSESELSVVDRELVMKSLEMQRSAMLMFTSCGWFFDDLSGIESLQILRYAAHAIQYAMEISGNNLEPVFLSFLGRAKSNIPDQGRGVEIYSNSVKPFSFDLSRLGAHYAILSLFTDEPSNISMYCYRVIPLKEFSLNAGKTRFCGGCLNIESDITLGSCRTWYASLGLGGHNVLCSLSPDLGEDVFSRFIEEVRSSFSKGDIPGIINSIDDFFGSHDYDLRHIFRNEQQKIFNSIIREDLFRLESFLREIIEDDYLLMNFISSVQMPVPPQFLKAAEVVLNSGIREEFDKDLPDLENIRNSFDTAKRWKIPLDTDLFALSASKWINSRIKDLEQNYHDIPVLINLTAFLKVIGEIGLKPDLWFSQNIFFRIKTDCGYAGLSIKDVEGFNGEWKIHFEELGRLLQVLI